MCYCEESNVIVKSLTCWAFPCNRGLALIVDAIILYNLDPWGVSGRRQPQNGMFPIRITIWQLTGSLKYKLKLYADDSISFIAEWFSKMLWIACMNDDANGNFKRSSRK